MSHPRLFPFLAFLSILMLMILACAPPDTPTPEPTVAATDVLPTAEVTEAPSTQVPFVATIEIIVDEPVNWLQKFLDENSIKNAVTSPGGTRLFVISEGKGGYLFYSEDYITFAGDFTAPDFANEDTLAFVLGNFSTALVLHKNFAAVNDQLDFVNEPIVAVTTDGNKAYVQLGDDIWFGPAWSNSGWARYEIGASNPIISPDGKYLAFQKGKQIAVRNLNTNGDAEILGPGKLSVWDEDVLYFVGTGTENPGIWTYDPNDPSGLPTHFAITNENITSMHWVNEIRAPEGTNDSGFILYANSVGEVFICDLAGISLKLDVPKAQIVGFYNPEPDVAFLLLSTDEGLIAHPWWGTTGIK